jgi:hypothetical protein
MNFHSPLQGDFIMNTNACPNDDAIPFTLVCTDCDAGMEIRSYEQAIAEGWTDIQYTPDLPMANYLGLCPVCQEMEG